MNLPGIVQSALDGEEIAARVDLGDDDLFVTPTRTIVYRSDSFLRDESVEEFPHAAERVVLSTGRKKSRFHLEYPLEGTKEFAVPSRVTEDVLHPLMAGVLRGNEITDPGESVLKTYQFSELTLILTSERLVKHVGGAIWDEDYEEHHFADVTDLTFEEGSVATQVVLTVDGRRERIKTPNEAARDLQTRLETALCEYHDVDSIEALRQRHGSDEPASADEQADEAFSFGVDALDTSVSRQSADAGEADTASTLETTTPSEPADGDPEAPPETDSSGAEAGTETEGAVDDGATTAGEPSDDTTVPSGETDRAAPESSGSTGTDDSTTAADTESSTVEPDDVDTTASTEASTVEPDDTDTTASIEASTVEPEDPATTGHTESSATDTDESPTVAGSPADRSDPDSADATIDTIDGPSDRSTDNYHARLDALEERLDRQYDLLLEQRQLIDELVRALEADR